MRSRESGRQITCRFGSVFPQTADSISGSFPDRIVSLCSVITQLPNKKECAITAWQKTKNHTIGRFERVGKNLTVYEYGKDMIIVDCGIGFPDDEMYGVDVRFPDISYLGKKRKPHPRRFTHNTDMKTTSAQCLNSCSR
jgi:hypothetical protein